MFYWRISVDGSAKRKNKAASFNLSDVVWELCGRKSSDEFFASLRSFLLLKSCIDQWKPKEMPSIPVFL